MSEAKEVHAYYCFDVLKNFLATYEKPRYSDSEIDNYGASALSSINEMFENKDYPLFITWTTNKRSMDELRGCIGNFEPMPLYTGLKDYALVSALRDTRFSPIKGAELADLSCSVSLLVNFEQAKDCYDWEIEKEDRAPLLTSQKLQVLSFYVNLTDTFIEEQGWNKPETLRSLMQKGGFRGEILDSDLENVKLTRYQSHKVRVTYAQYQDFLLGRK